MLKFKLLVSAIMIIQSCTSLDYSAIEDSWSYDEFRKYALLRCTAKAFQNETQFEIARQYYEKSESLLAVSRHPARIYYHLDQEAKNAADNLTIEQSGRFCMDWVLSKKFEFFVIQTLSSP
ncbi:MAG: hypothetical protein HRU38_19165 [Saccharospirillaceae bacterium]|nr:hypothetical protein [Pseudomonadales bacterium]NRB80756.1 hypothetical protein [Saccharospirillaceae bacterium]